MTLQLNEYDVHVSPESCKHILELLSRGKTDAFFYCLDMTRHRGKKTFKRHFFKFFYRDQAFQVAAKRFSDLEKALKDGITGESEFMIGWRAISCEATESRRLRLDDDGNLIVEEQDKIDTNELL